MPTNIPITSTHVWVALLALGVFSVFWSLERFLFFLSRLSTLRARARQRCIDEYLRIVLQSKGSLEDARRLARASKVKGLHLDLLRLSEGTVQGLRKVAEKEKRSAERFERFREDAYAIATSCGLLGTVLGMLEAFSAGTLQSSGVSQSIAMAMGTTAAGIVIGLFVTYGVGILVGKWSARLSDDVDAVVRQFLSRLQPPRGRKQSIKPRTPQPTPERRAHQRREPECTPKPQSEELAPAGQPQ